MEIQPIWGCIPLGWSEPEVRLARVRIDPKLAAQRTCRSSISRRAFIG